MYLYVCFLVVNNNAVLHTNYLHTSAGRMKHLGKSHIKQGGSSKENDIVPLNLSYAGINY